jgi:hypothetical protein
MRLSIAPPTQSRSPSRGPGSLAATPKPKTPRLTAQQAGAKPIRVMGVGGPLRIFSETLFPWEHVLRAPDAERMGRFIRLRSMPGGHDMKHLLIALLLTTGAAAGATKTPVAIKREPRNNDMVGSQLYADHELKLCGGGESTIKRSCCRLPCDLR